MHNIDFSPLFRHSIGFDRMQKMVDAATRLDSTSQNYPPYNIETFSENNYAISLAVAGFAPEDLDVTVKENTLILSGQAQAEENNKKYMHRGIARRAFERRFQLADTVKVSGSSLENGMLRVDLVREIPQAQQPRKIKIASSAAPRDQIEADKAA